MVLKMKDTNSACLSAVPHVPHLAKFLMPFYKCWAGAGWQQCKRPFLTQGVGRWFQRYWFFESGFCPDCVWFLPFRPPLLTNEMTHVLLPFMPSTECSDLDSGNPNLVFKLSNRIDICHSCQLMYQGAPVVIGYIPRMEIFRRTIVIAELKCRRHFVSGHNMTLFERRICYFN